MLITPSLHPLTLTHFVQGPVSSVGGTLSQQANFPASLSQCDISIIISNFNLDSHWNNYVYYRHFLKVWKTVFCFNSKEIFLLDDQALCHLEDGAQQSFYRWFTSAAAAAKSLQLCPTLRDPIDGSPTGSSEEPGRLQSVESHRVGHDWATSLSLFTFMHRRRKWQPIPVFLPGESQGRSHLYWFITQSVFGVHHESRL